MKIPPLTLHIGYPRTATTLLQKQFDESNPHVFFLGRKVQSTNRWADEKFGQYWEWVRFGQPGIDVEAARAHIERHLTQAAQRGARAVLVSDEKMSKPHMEEWFDALARRLSSLLPDANILLTLRNQIDLVFSLYGLYKRTCGSSADPFAQWVLDGGNSRYVPVQERFNFYELYSALIRHYGAERIHFLFYEDFLADAAGYARKLAAVLEVSEVTLDSTKIINASGPRPGRGVARRYIRSTSAPTFDSCISEAQQRFLAHLFYKDNDRFSELTGLDLTSRGYPTRHNMEQKYEFYRC